MLETATQHWQVWVDPPLPSDRACGAPPARPLGSLAQHWGTLVGPRVGRPDQHHKQACLFDPHWSRGTPAILLEAAPLRGCAQSHQRGAARVKMQTHCPTAGEPLANRRAQPNQLQVEPVCGITMLKPLETQKPKTPKTRVETLANRPSQPKTPENHTRLSDFQLSPAPMV